MTTMIMNILSIEFMSIIIVYYYNYNYNNLLENNLTNHGRLLCILCKKNILIDSNNEHH